jgi:hypothetical protein
MNIGSPIDIFVLFIIFIKIVFILTSIGHVILTHMTRKGSDSGSNDKKKQEKDIKLMYWKERTEFIFIASMAILLIYYFNPRNMKPLTKETSLLFYLFGWVLLITAKWGIFIKDAKWYSLVSSISSS